MAKEDNPSSECKVFSIGDYPGEYHSYLDEEFVVWVRGLDDASRRNVANEVSDIMMGEVGVSLEVRERFRREFRDISEDPIGFSKILGKG